MGKTIDFEQSAIRGRATVALGVDTELDVLKYDYDGMGSLLTEVSSSLLTEVPNWARHNVHNCIFLPQLGFLTVVEMDKKTGAAKYCGQGLPEEPWEKAFSAANAVYCKNRRMRELDAHLGDAYGTIVGLSPYPNRFPLALRPMPRCDSGLTDLVGLTRPRDRDIA